MHLTTAECNMKNATDTRIQITGYVPPKIKAKADAAAKAARISLARLVQLAVEAYLAR